MAGARCALSASMPAPFPHQYRTTIARTLPSRARIASGEMPSLHSGPSSQLDGDATTWSAEQLLLSALGTCMLTTFEAFAARDKIDVLAWSATAAGTVDRTPEGLQFTSIVLTLQMTISGNIAVVEQTVDDAKAYSLVLQSLRVPMVVETVARTIDGTLLPTADRRSGPALAFLEDDWRPVVEETVLRAG